MNITYQEQESEFYLPSLEILKSENSEIHVDEEEISENKILISKTLENFDIPVLHIESKVGPAVTQYEVTLPDPIRISKIRSILDDISRELGNERLFNARVFAPIPGKNAIGVEIANKTRKIVRLKDILGTKEFQESYFSLPIAIGCTLANKPYIADLTKMPHLLIIGATGLGKSVLQNVVVTSLLYRKKPDEVKFVIIDPSRVEFSPYNKIENQYLAKCQNAKNAIVSDTKEVLDTLNSLCIEMNNRFKLLHKASSRNFREYNDIIKLATTHQSLLPKLPYIVVIINDYEDIIMTAGKQIEKSISMLAQKGRSVGIHLVIATDRPNTKIISPAIQANFPARIAFKVMSKKESKVILDRSGAECLTGRGDMLISNNATLERVQGAYIEDSEIKQLCDYISEYTPKGVYLLPEVKVAELEEPEEEADPLLKECAIFLYETKQISISSLQRKFHIGYNRASRIIDQLQKDGILSPPTRVMLATREEIEKL